MKIEIYGRPEKTSPGFYLDAVGEYIKRLGPYCSVKYIPVRKQKQWERLTDPEEGSLDYTITPGKDTFSSEEMSRHLLEWETAGYKKIRFFTGEEADGRRKTLHLSAFDLPPAMQAMILAEQIYRGYRIRNNQPYHK